MRGRLAMAAAGALLCGLSCNAGRDRIERRFDFRSPVDPGWSAGFADVPVAYDRDVGFVADHRPLGAPLVGNGLYQYGLNVSDDLFMWFAGRATGFTPGEAYAVSFEVGIASRAGAGCEVGTPASTDVKVGASSFEPARVVVDGRWVMNIDHGSPHRDSATSLVLGDIRNALPGCPHVDPPCGERTLSSGDRRLRVRADDDGAIWIWVATDSAFEAPVEVYFTYVTIQAVPAR